MAEANNGHDNPPPRRVLDDYAQKQGPRHFSSIALPNNNRAIVMQPTFLTLVSSSQFMGLDHEDPHPSSHIL